MFTPTHMKARHETPMTRQRPMTGMAALEIDLTSFSMGSKASASAKARAKMTIGGPDGRGAESDDRFSHLFSQRDHK